jgi:MYXO-CTERM domain-containing protein
MPVRCVGLALHTAIIAIIIAITPGVARAELDSFGLGDGHDGPLVVSSLLTVNPHAALAADAAGGGLHLSTATVADFRAGDLVFVWQPLGLAGAVPQVGTSSVDLHQSPIGRFELARLARVTGTDLELTNPLVGAYPNGLSQVVRVPEYTTVTIEPSGAIVAPPWDGASGGVVAFLVSGILTVNGTISASGAGFRGGVAVNDDATHFGCVPTEPSPPWDAAKGEGVLAFVWSATATGQRNAVNGGGGGDCTNSGGAGGGNGGPGGTGGNSWDGDRPVGGQGGAQIQLTFRDRFTFGGGGGAGQMNDQLGTAGGSGGGLVWLRAASLAGTGTIAANGAMGPIPNVYGNTPDYDGQGGGGAGGSISLRLTGAVACSVLMTARGATGISTPDTGHGLSGPGGGGGGGHVLFQASTPICPIDVRAGLAGFSGDPINQNNLGATPVDDADRQNYIGVVEDLGPVVPPPPAPSLITPADGSSTAERRPLVSGTALPNVTVVVLLDAVEVARVMSDAQGSWSLVPAADLPNGVHLAAAVAFSGGEYGPSSAVHRFTVDTRPGLSVLTPAAGSEVPTPQATFSGTTAPGLTVQVAVPGAGAASGDADLSGRWSIMFEPLANGSYTASVSVTDSGGATALRLRSFVIAGPLPPITITVPSEGATVSERRPNVTGTALDGASIVLSAEGRVLGSTIAVGGGWSITPYFSLSNGLHRAHATATDPLGNSATATRTFTVHGVGPPVGILVPAEGATIAPTDQTITGTTTAGGTVYVAVDSGPANPVLADAQGRWSLMTLMPWIDGPHSVQASTTNGAGDDATTKRDFTVASKASGCGCSTSRPPNPHSSVALFGALMALLGLMRQRGRSRRWLAAPLLVLAIGCGKSQGSSGMSVYRSGVEPGVDMTTSLSTSTQRLFAAYAKARGGLPADLDGDGRDDVTPSTLTDGTRVYAIDDHHDGTPDSVGTYAPNGDSELVFDRNNDGTMDLKITFTAKAAWERVTLDDANYDGRFERRETVDYDPLTNQLHVVVERDDVGQGQYTTVSDDFISASQSSGTSGNCDEQAGFPSHDWRSYVTGDASNDWKFGDSNVHVMQNNDGHGGRCTPGQAARIRDALDCAFDHGRRCLEDTNHALRQKLDQIRIGQGNTIYVACSDSCPASDANTLYLPPAASTMAINPSHFAQENGNDLCGVVLHELIHALGEGLDPKTHDLGTDRSYGCGRYCGGHCNSRGPTATPPGSAWDCAACAGTSEEKAQCGDKLKIKPALASDHCGDFWWCHEGGFSYACSSCGRAIAAYCDDSDVPDAVPANLCCVGCPKVTQREDQACRTTPPCTNSPPWCSLL